MDHETARMAYMIGRTISHNEVLEKVSEDGMGVMHEVRDTDLARFVATKEVCLAALCVENAPIG